MPGMHIQGAGYQRHSGGTVVLASIRRGWFQAYHGDEPIQAFPLPMNNMQKEGEPVSMSWDELVGDVQRQSDLWFTIRVYRNYEDELDAHIQWAGDTELYHYVLQMPHREAAPDAETIENEDESYGAYPAPQQWYYAIGKRFVRTIDNYDGVD